MSDFKIHLRDLKKILIKLDYIDLLNNVDLEIQKFSLNELRILILGIVDKKTILKLNENFPNVKFIYNKEILDAFNTNDELKLSQPIHLVIQFLNATQPVTKTDRHTYLKISKYFLPEHHFIIVNHIEDIEDNEIIEVKEYIENKIKEFVIQSQKVIYLSRNCNEFSDILINCITNKKAIINQSLEFNLRRLYLETVNQIEKEINKLENYNEYTECRIVELKRRLLLLKNTGATILHYLKISQESPDILISRIISFAKANNLKINFDISKEKNLLLQEFIRIIEDNCKDIRNEIIDLYQKKCDKDRLLTVKEQLYILESKGV